MIMICDLKTAKATIVQSTVNKLHVATPGEQLNTTVHISFLLQLTVLMSSVGRINGRAQLIVYVRYIHNRDFKDELLCCRLRLHHTRN